MISATVTGNIGKDCRTGSAGDTPVVNFSIASRRYDGAAKEEKTDWVEVSFFGGRAEKLAKYLTKGSRVAVRGSLYVREYEHNREKRYALTLRADDVELLGGAANDTRPPATTPAPSSERDLPF